ncbi:MAG TPA: Crp/Fnr family transcriptional regulator, partial [Candidatus Kapabacteria bacterium]|nr:Crp/Fnr family transcriptional regulator [Candidatus Kapabacteria bacterium]
GQFIFSEGQRPKGLYCLLEGSVKVLKECPRGEESTLSVAKPGDLIGHTAFFSHKVYSSSAVALEDSRICCIESSSFDELQKSSPEISRRIIDFLCGEIENDGERIVSLGRRSVRERLAEHLIHLIESDRTEPTPRVPVILLSSRELANMIGTAPETTSRALSQLKSERLIAMEKGKIKVLNAAKLRLIAQVE